MAFKCGENLSRFVVFSLADQETGTIWQERTETPDTDCEEDLESEGEAPGDIAWGEGKA